MYFLTDLHGMCYTPEESMNIMKKITGKAKVYEIKHKYINTQLRIYNTFPPFSNSPLL